MKKNIPEYIAELSKNNFESFEEIFDNKFKKFRQLYWLLCEYSEYISSLNYNETDKDVLSVDVEFTKKANTDEIAENIISSIETNNIEISNFNNKLTITITLDESVSP